jgi:glycerol kinase
MRSTSSCGIATILASADDEEPTMPERPQHLLALDQGTSSSRAIVFDARGQIVALAQREFRQIFPQPGWVEHDPKEIWSSQLATASEAIAKAGLAAGGIAAIGITNQRETTVVWNRATGEPIANAIVWQDRRTAAACEALKQRGLESLVRERTGLVIDAYFSGTKLAWLLDNVPGARAAAECGELAFGTVDSWLMWLLTGGASAATRVQAVHATDASNASRTMLYDVPHGGWSDELLAALDIPRAVLPEVHPSSHVFGRTSAELFGAPIAIGGACGDQQSALFGQACFRPGQVKNTYGTGCFMLMNTGDRFEPSANGLIATSAAQPGAARQFAREGSVFIGGAVVQWLRDGLEGDPFEQRDRAARRERSRQRRRAVRPRVHRARRAALESGCARHDRRPDARLDDRARRPRRARVDRVPERGAARRDEPRHRRRRRLAGRRVARRRRRERQRPA